MDSRIKDLSAYRFEKAEKTLEMAKRLFEEKEYGFSSNRAYYSAFYAMRAVNALDGFDSSKHSGVIAHFNRNYVKTERFDASVSRLIGDAAQLREKSDYEDYYVPPYNEVKTVIITVEQFLGDVRTFLEKKNII